MKSSFFGKIKYRKERVGVVEKDGKTYIKYIKARRFRLSNNAKLWLLGVFIILILGLSIKLLMSELDFRAPAEWIAAG